MRNKFRNVRKVLHFTLLFYLNNYWSSDSSSLQVGASEVHGGGGDAEGSAAPQHRPLLRLLEVNAEGPQVHHPGDGAHDLRDPEDVSPLQRHIILVPEGFTGGAHLCFYAASGTCGGFVRWSWSCWSVGASRSLRGFSSYTPAAPLSCIET